LKTDVVGEECVQLGAQVALQQPHECPDLGGRALPVLDRKGVQGKDVYSEAGTGLDRIANRVDTGAMALDARQMTLRSPSPVAVHDDGDMRREPLEMQLIHEHAVGIAGRNPRQQLVTRHVACPLSASA